MVLSRARLSALFMRCFLVLVVLFQCLETVLELHLVEHRTGVLEWDAGRFVRNLVRCLALLRALC